MNFTDMTYEKQYELFFQPICDVLSQHKVEFVVHTAKEEDYSDLADDKYSCYIEIINPYRPDTEYGVQIDDEIILYHNDSHGHVDIYEDDNPADVVKELLKTIEDIIENRLAGYILLCGDGWLHGGGGNLNDLAIATKDPCMFADESITEPEFEIKLRSEGGRHVFTFWNPVFDREIEIPKREYTFFYYHISDDGNHPTDRFVTVNDADTQNVVLINTDDSHHEKYRKTSMTIPHDAVSSIVQLIKSNPDIMSFDDESLWQKEELPSVVTSGVYNSILFGDGTEENTVGEFGLWDYEDGSTGTLQTVFEVFHRIKAVLIDEGVPEEYLATKTV